MRLLLPHVPAAPGTCLRHIPGYLECTSTSSGSTGMRRPCCCRLMWHHGSQQRSEVSQRGNGAKRPPKVASSKPALSLLQCGSRRPFPLIGDHVGMGLEKISLNSEEGHTSITDRLARCRSTDDPDAIS